MEPSGLVQTNLSNQRDQSFTITGHQLYGTNCFMPNSGTNNTERVLIDYKTTQHKDTSGRDSSLGDTASSGQQTTSSSYDTLCGVEVQRHCLVNGDLMDEEPPILTGLFGQTYSLGFHERENRESCQKTTAFGLDKLHYTPDGVNSFNPFQQGKTLQNGGFDCDSNQNSDTKNLVMKIISFKNYSTLVDIIKSLPAVTSPRCALVALNDLEQKGLIRRMPTIPVTWAKADVKNGMNIELSLTSSFGEDVVGLNTSKWVDAQLHGTDGESTVGINRSRSSPSLAKQHSLSGFLNRPHRKCSDTVLNGICSDTRTSLQPRCSTNSRGFELNSSLNVQEDSSTESFRELPFHPLELNPLQKSIIDVLTQNNRPLTTLEIAKAIGLTTKRDVNSSLYALERAGVIQRVRYQPPVWSLKCRKDPGVIGEERNQQKPSRRKSFNEAILSGRNQSRSEVEILKPRSRSFNSEGDTSGVKSCGLCKISFTSKQQSDEHFQSTKHQNKIAKVTSEPYLKFCDYCKVHLNSKSQANEHFTSGRHEQTVAKSQKAPVRQHPPLQTPPEGFDPNIHTETTPFGYQVELYYKAMSANSVCFLPTGTGKTLVAALVVAHLLQLNPTRQIIFLVDRVILVIQQSEYLKNELKNLQIPLSAKDEDQNATKASLNGRHSASHDKPLRPVRIGAICGEMRKLEQGVPIFNHDILVVTADCYRNHINNGTLRFEDSALIVLDESHHCNKDHPYNVIIRDYYLIEDVPLSQRPKILGLTASPAGEPTLERTLKKMQRLLANLGGASLLTVTENIPELTERTSQAEMVCYCAEYTSTEENLLSLLMEYATKCFNLAARLSEFKEYKDVFQPSAGGVLSKDDIYPILGVIDNLVNSPKSETANVLNSLVHFEIICDCICTLTECGEEVAFNRMIELMQGNCPHGFDWADSQGLPCDKIRTYLQQRFIEGSSVPRHFGNMASGVAELLELLLSFEWGENEDRLALVLVKRRCTAVCLAEYLNSCSELCSRLIRSTYVIGHGNRGTDRGMTVAQQIETLKQIRQGIFQVVVATSVAEEGLNLPACDLVVQMDPPNSVTALVQIRGRARQRRAQFAAICRDRDQAKKIKDLIAREDNMRQAAQIINGHNLSANRSLVGT